MPNNWRTYKLSDAFEIIGGGTPKTTVNEYWNGNIPWLSVVDFNNDQRTVLNTEKAITEVGLQKSSTKLLKKGQLIISARGTVGKLAQLGKDMAFNQSCYGLSGKNNILINDYGYYLLKYSVSNILSNTHGSVFDTITRSTFENIVVNIPSIKEQTTIASILSALDDKIELNLQINKTLEEIAMTLYKHWFVDFGPFKNGEFIDSELGKIPKGWEVNYFGDLIEKIIDNRGKTPPLSKTKTEYLLLETYQLNRKALFPNSIKNNKAKYVTKKIYNNPKWFRKGHPKYMDILFATVGNGIPNWSFMYENNGVGIAQNVVAIRAKLNIPSAFLRYSFESKSFLDQFDGYVITTAQPSIKLSDLNMVKMIKPSDESLKEWYSIIGPLVNEVYLNYKENQTLTTLRDTLLPKLICGEVRVNEAEKILAEVL